MCFQRRGGTPGLSRIEDWSIVEDLQPYAAEITLQGGEITLLPQFRRFLARAARPEFSHTKVSIITNGTIWDQELSRLFGEVRVGFIVVSLNAAKAETFHAITGVDSFHTVTANVENVLKLSRTHKYTNFDVILSFVVMRSNFEELPAFLDLSSRLGTQAQVSPVDPDGSSEDPWCDHATHGRMRAVLDRASLLAAPKTLSQIQSIVKLLLRCPMCGRA
jgi:MoaA/NifB/PqqE/SkfB family radical SAM enzyme